MQEQTKALNFVSLPELTHTYTHTREVEYELVRGREAEGRHVLLLETSELQLLFSI